MASLFTDMMDEAGEQSARIAALQAEVRGLQTDLSWERNENARLRALAGEPPRERASPTSPAHQSGQGEAPPAIVPMGPGERPTEAGWYAARYRVDGVVLLTEVTGTELRLGLAEEGGEVDYVARLYPDRIAVDPEILAKPFERRRRGPRA